LAGEKNWKKLYAHPITGDQSYIAEWEHFLNCIRNKTQPFINGENGLSVVKIIEAIRSSSFNAKEMTVEVEEI
jgi:predicted dehydrogenase